MNNTGLEQLEERLGVRFKKRELLERALTHRSAASENTLESNERLEFLGDSVVGLVVCENLYLLFPDSTEGNLAKSKAYIVSEASLADAAQALGLEQFVRMSAGEAASGGRRRRSILADAFEAVIAAIYLDCGIRAARRVVRKALLNVIYATVADEHRGDFKSFLQEQAQALVRITPVYRIISEKGHEHEKLFTAQALVGEEVIGQGTGRSKKEAEQAAAKDALENLPNFFPSAAESSQETVPNGVQ